MASPAHWRALDLTRSNPVSDQYDDTSGSFWHWRWLAGSVVLVPVMLAAGVYWLHHMPTGPSARQGNSTIQVELLPSPTPSPEVKQASLHASPPIADFQVTPTISEQVLPPVEVHARAGGDQLAGDAATAAAPATSRGISGAKAGGRRAGAPSPGRNGNALSAPARSAYRALSALSERCAPRWLAGNSDGHVRHAS